jgi:hypothetical protein
VHRSFPPARSPSTACRSGDASVAVEQSGVAQGLARRAWGAIIARIIHERFCCNRGFAAPTSLSAGVLAAQSFDVLLQVRLSSSRLCLPVSQRDSTISRRTVMNNAG